MFEIGVVRANECEVRGHNRDMYMKVCCVISLESPHRGDSNEYTQYTIFSTKEENPPKLY